MRKETTLSDQENLKQDEEQEEVEAHKIHLNTDDEADVEGHKLHLKNEDEDGDDVEAHRSTVSRPHL